MNANELLNDYLLQDSIFCESVYHTDGHKDSHQDNGMDGYYHNDAHFDYHIDGDS